MDKSTRQNRLPRERIVPGTSSVVVVVAAVSSAISDENIGPNDVRATGAGAMNAVVWDAARATLRTTAENFMLVLYIVWI